MWIATLEPYKRLIPAKATKPVNRGLFDKRPPEKTKIEFAFDAYRVVLTGTGDPIAFGLSGRMDKLGNVTITFCDKREAMTGSDTGGLWASRPPKKSGSSRTLTPTAWKVEVSRLIGSDQADEIIRQSVFFVTELLLRREAKKALLATNRQS